MHGVGTHQHQLTALHFHATTGHSQVGFDAVEGKRSPRSSVIYKFKGTVISIIRKGAEEATDCRTASKSALSWCRKPSWQ